MIGAGTITSLTSLAVSIASAFIAKSALEQAKLAVQEQTRSVQEQKLANEQAHGDWAQRKWFDLYFKVEQACNALENYQAIYQHGNPATPSAQQYIDAKRVTFLFREAGAMALVFPKNEVVDKLLETVKFSSVTDMAQPMRLKAISDALEMLRQKALVDRRVLDVLTGA